MAQATGFTCDRAGCGKFQAAASNGSSAELPPGWIMVRPQPRNKTVEVQGKDGGKLEFCSNFCAAWVFLDRYEDESGGKRLVRQNPRT